MMLPWIVVGALVLTIMLLIVKIRQYQTGLKEIQAEFEKHLSTDTNNLITVSSNNRRLKKLAAALNEQLRILRTKRRRYESGDQELKEAITNISHDLRTPLTAISGYLELLEKEEKSAAATHYTATIKNRTNAMQDLIEQLFHYSLLTSYTHTQPLQLETISLNAALQEGISSYYEALKAQAIEPSIVLPDEDVHCLADRQLIARIIENLLSNVIKYSDGDLQIRLSQAGTITFTNTASTLNTVEVEKLFNRFYTVESARHSTGLGLSIVKSLVEQMNGQIAAVYEEDRLVIEVMFPTIPH